MAPRLLITGSRSWTDHDLIDQALAYWWFNNGEDLNAVLVHGDCSSGADAIAKRLWTTQGLTDEPHAAQWDLYGKKAGMYRNTHMVLYGADACYASIRDQSPGATHCARIAEQQGIPTYRFRATS